MSPYNPSVRKAGPNPPESGSAGTEERFQIERLEESRIAAANVKSLRNERSQEVVENKGKCVPNASKPRGI